VTGTDPSIVSEHACYLCGYYALDPRQCFNTNEKGSPCEALYCLPCL